LDALTVPRATPPPKSGGAAATTATAAPTSSPPTERKATSTSTTNDSGFTAGDYVDEQQGDGSVIDDDIALMDFDYEAPDPVWRARRKQRVSTAESLIEQLEAIAASQRRAARM
jgi:hypothetical protein